VTSAVIRADRLVGTFGSFIAVDDVSFAVEPGEIIGLLGANGAGKTTTIRMVVGLLGPTSGNAFLLGATPNRETRKHVGYVPQGLGLYSDLTVRQNLHFAADAFGVEPAETKGTLADEADRLVGDVSLGVQRQLAFECALQHSPDALILDEPTSGVEPLAAARLWDRIRVEAERGAGVLVSTHSMQEANQCDRLLMLADGRIVAEGTEEDIIADTSAIQVTTDSWSHAFEALTGAGILVSLDGRAVRAVDTPEDRVRAALANAGITASLETTRATLEERMAALASE